MSKIIGIDLGSTFSAVSVMEGTEPKIIVSEEGSRTIPSVVGYNKDEVSVGQSAVRQATINPETTVYLAKRFIGRRYNEVLEDAKLMPFKVVNGNNDMAYFDLKGKKVSPQEVSAKVLQKLKRDAEKYLGEEVNDVVITVPAYFNDAQRQATKEAGVIAGFKNVRRIISEPTAAALAYGFGAGKNKGEQTIAVYDFGGGTFDISVLEVGENVVEVFATNGNSKLGGHDINNRVVAYVLSEFKKQEGVDLSKDKMALQRINEAVEKAKIELSSTAETSINLPFLTANATGPKHLDLKLSRATLEKLVVDLVESSLEPCRKALEDAGKKTSDIDEVLLVGGQTRMPLIVETVKKFFGKEPNRSVNPDEAVSIGATIQGSILSGDVKDLLLLDVLPLSLGIETLGGVMTTLIPRNTTIPTKKSEVFSTAADNQSSVEIHILQGERPMASQNKPLGRFNLDGIPPAPRGLPQIEVQLDVDANGILNVSAKDKATGKEQKITITQGSGLSKEDIEKMVNEAKEHEEEDKRKKEEVEERNKADTLAYQVEKSLNDNKDRVSQSTADDVNAKLSDLKEALNKNSGIKEATEALTKASHKLAEELYKASTTQTEQTTEPQNDGKVVDAEFTEN